jgi:ATP-dependent protease Clp ATPase subunit
MSKHSGARGLRAVLEEVLLDTMFDLASKPGTYRLDAAAVEAGNPVHVAEAA